MKRFFKKHWSSAGITLIACLSSGMFLLVINHVEQQRADVAKKQQTEAFVQLDKAVEARLAKQKAETAEKEKAGEKAKKDNENKAKEAQNDAAISISTTNGAHRDPTQLDIIVNKKHPITPLSYTPRVTTVSCAGRGATTISPAAVSDFQALCSAAAKAGVPLDSSSSYRSYSAQVSTYSYWVSVSGKKGADTYSARPGYSEHQTGLSVDFRVPGGAQLSDFTGTKQQKWLAKNAWKYGFIQRYTTSNQKDTGYTAESWHYRYVGRSIATAYTSAHARSLETYWGISGGSYN